MAVVLKAWGCWRRTRALRSTSGARRFRQHLHEMSKASSTRSRRLPELGEIAIDAVQMFAPSAFSGMLGRAGLTTGNKATDLALGLAGSKYTTLAENKFTVDAATDMATAVARTPVSRWRRWRCCCRAGVPAMMAKARSGGDPCGRSVPADNLFEGKTQSVITA